MSALWTCQTEGGGCCGLAGSTATSRRKHCRWQLCWPLCLAAHAASSSGHSSFGRQLSPFKKTWAPFLQCQMPELKSRQKRTPICVVRTNRTLTFPRRRGRGRWQWQLWSVLFSSASFEMHAACMVQRMGHHYPCLPPRVRWGANILIHTQGTWRSVCQIVGR